MSWDRAHGVLPAILSGMVGSTIGWREAPYAPCPVAVRGIAAAALRFTDRGRAIAIVPGLSCINASGVADVMRGEETQIAGALRLDGALERGRHLFCLPGTHSKWALVEDGAVVRFQSALAGELFDLLCRHSVLARGSGPADPAHDAFALGMALARKEDAGLLHTLFSARSRVLAADFPASDAASYLSGLIVGADVAGAMRLFAPHSVVLVCAPALARLYAKVLDDYNVPARAIDGDQAALAGLTSLLAGE